VRIIITILLLLNAALMVKAQEKEHFRLFTDRDLYISGETLLLKVFATSEEQSGIVNINMINRRGKKITGIILEIIDHQSDGFVYLPDSLSSGRYLLCASTGTNNIATIRELYIANRFIGLPQSNDDIRTSGSIVLNESSVNDLQINGVEKQYKPREKGSAIVKLPDELINRIDGNLSACIAGMTPEFTSPAFLTKLTAKTTHNTVKEGIIFEGIVTDLKTSEPYKNAEVYLSIPDSIPEFQYYITGEDGHFYFQISKYYGKIPVVIQCFTKDKSRLLKITLSDRDNIGSVMPDFETYKFPPDFRKSVEKNIEAITFRKIFNQQEITIQPNPPVKSNTYPFYGIPTKTVDPQLFIDLPDFNEISKELLPGVKFRNYNRIPTLQVFNLAQQRYFDDQPLLLLDGIPIRDLNVLKDMGTKDIDKIEICQSERFYGDLIFQGVVAIYTSKADYTRVPESDDLVKLNIEVFQPHMILNEPSGQLPNDPDLRQVLLWKPSLKTEQTFALNFQTSDIRGSFRLTIRGKTKDGSIFYKEQIFEVN
jgi:hypothetical protein